VIRGAIYRIDLGGPRSHEQGGKRLGLVVSPSDSPLSVVTVIPTSTSAGHSIHRPEIEVAGRTTRLLVDQIRSIDIRYVEGDPVDYLTRDQLFEVELALAHYLGIQDATPPRPF
jgi:mRNA interferase MazF